MFTYMTERIPCSAYQRSGRSLSVLLALSGLISPAFGWRQFTGWTDKHWCESVIEPEWPFAYAKVPLQSFEPRGRTAQDLQDMGHVCNLRGALSKCHRCEDIACGPALDQVCNYQIQGVPPSALAANIPSVPDTPFAVGNMVSHRHDYGNASRICVMLSAGDCLDPATTDWS